MFLSSGLAEAVVVNCHMPIDIEKKVMLKVVGENFENIKFNCKSKVVFLSTGVRTSTLVKIQITVGLLTLFHRLCVPKWSDGKLMNFFTHTSFHYSLFLFT